MEKRSMDKEKALHGVRILDFTHAVMGGRSD